MNLEPQEVIDCVVGTQGNIPLAAERLTRRKGEKVLEYDVIELLTRDSSLVETVMKQLRALLMIKLFELVMQTHHSMMSSLDDLAPKDLAVAHSQLIDKFNSLTSVAAKSQFDIELEAQKAAAEFDVTPEEVLKELKHLGVK